MYFFFISMLLEIFIFSIVIGGHQNFTFASSKRARNNSEFIRTGAL
jgi:hypothetical protein